MGNQIVYFIEKDGVKRYKCDTVWSMDQNPERAKVHTPDHERFFESLKLTVKMLRGLKNTHGIDQQIPPDYGYLKDKIAGSIFGYSTFSEDQLKNSVSLKKECVFTSTHYLYIITDITNDHEVIYKDYRIENRNNKIKLITNEKSVD